MTTDNGEFSVIETTTWHTMKQGPTESAIVAGDGEVCIGMPSYYADNIVQAHNLTVRDLQDEIKRLTEWIGDLQSGLYVNCIYCGHRYPPGTPDVRDQALYNHIKDCLYHPLSKALDQIVELKKTRAALAELMIVADKLHRTAEELPLGMYPDIDISFDKLLEEIYHAKNIIERADCNGQKSKD